MTANRRVVGVGMVIAALVLGIGLWILYDQAQADIDEDNLANQYEAIIGGAPVVEEEVDAVPYIVGSGVAGLLLLGGVILIADTPPAAPHPEGPADDDPVPT